MSRTPNTLRDLYADNGANGDNVRDYVTRETRYESAAWNPVYCVYGWPHIVFPDDPNRCGRCETRRSDDRS